MLVSKTSILNKCIWLYLLLYRKWHKNNPISTFLTSSISWLCYSTEVSLREKKINKWSSVSSRVISFLPSSLTALISSQSISACFFFSACLCKVEIRLPCSPLGGAAAQVALRPPPVNRPLQAHNPRKSTWQLNFKIETESERFCIAIYSLLCRRTVHA